MRRLFITSRTVHLRKRTLRQKKNDNCAPFLNKHANTVNEYASTHKDNRVRKANTNGQKGNDSVQKANKRVQGGMNAANSVKGKLIKA